MSQNTKKRVVGAHITSNQKNRLQAILAERPQLRSAKFSANFTAKEAAKQWQEIAEELNAIPGASKDWKAWRKTWQDIYSKIKGKQAKINKSLWQTGGGPPAPPLNEFESSVAELINPRVVSGHVESQETAVEFDFARTSPIEEVENIVVYQITEEEEPPTQNQNHTNQKKINIKSLMKEKIQIKKSYYEEKIKIMKEQNEHLRVISASVQTILDRLDLMIPVYSNQI